MSEAKIPGIKALHAVITDACRQGRGEEGAIDEALARLRDQYLGLAKFWSDKGGVQFHLVLTVDKSGLRKNDS